MLQLSTLSVYLSCVFLSPWLHFSICFQVAEFVFYDSCLSVCPCYFNSDGVLLFAVLLTGQAVDMAFIVLVVSLFVSPTSLASYRKIKINRKLLLVLGEG